MITLQPSIGVKKSTGIDFTLLSDLLTTLFETGHKRMLDITAKVHLSKVEHTSLCEAVDDNNYIIKLDQSSKQTKKFVFGSILHELRHCCQNHIWDYWPDSTKFRSYNEYFMSKEERDARKAEKLTRDLIKIYDMHVTFNQKFKKTGLNILG